jgi:ring-1,2-phenylacetyl-CoA epoxidase subunit PaaC
LAAIAEKSLKEVTYHLRWSSEWVIRLGDGTEESHQRMLKAIDELWPYSGELFEAASYEQRAAKEGWGVDPSSLKSKWEERVKEVFSEATLPYPKKVSMKAGGKKGDHTEQLSNILADLQFMQEHIQIVNGNPTLKGFLKMDLINEHTDNLRNERNIWKIP